MDNNQRQGNYCARGQCARSESGQSAVNFNVDLRFQDRGSAAEHSRVEQPGPSTFHHLSSSSMSVSSPSQPNFSPLTAYANLPRLVGDPRSPSESISTVVPSNPFLSLFQHPIYGGVLPQPVGPNSLVVPRIQSDLLPSFEREREMLQRSREYNELRRERRALESAEEREPRLEYRRRESELARLQNACNRQVNFQMKMAGFNYSPTINYSSHPKFATGPMDFICPSCNACAFKEELAGICCSNGKFSLSESHRIVEPVDPSLADLYSGGSPLSHRFKRDIQGESVATNNFFLIFCKNGSFNANFLLADGSCNFRNLNCLRFIRVHAHYNSQGAPASISLLYRTLWEKNSSFQYANSTSSARYSALSVNIIN